MPRNGRSAAIQARIGLDEAALAQAVHRRRRGTDAGHDEQVRARRSRRRVTRAVDRAPAAVSACSIDTRLPAP